ncbi:hypothetical protein RYX36_022388 [Vicia faba]
MIHFNQVMCLIVNPSPFPILQNHKLFSIAKDQASNYEHKKPTIEMCVQDQSQNPVNYFFLLPSENPCVVLVSPTLSEPNYHNWSMAMKKGMSSKKDIHLLNASCTATHVMPLLRRHQI